MASKATASNTTEQSLVLMSIGVDIGKDVFHNVIETVTRRFGRRSR